MTTANCHSIGSYSDQSFRNEVHTEHITAAQAVFQQLIHHSAYLLLDPLIVLFWNMALQLLTCKNLFPNYLCDLHICAE